MLHAFNMLRVLTDPRIVMPAFREIRRDEDADFENPPESPRAKKKDVGWRQRLGAIRFLLRWLWRERLTRHCGQWVIGSYMPPFPGPAYDRFFAGARVGRRLSPFSAFLALTSRCPADCWHCSLKGRHWAKT